MTSPRTEAGRRLLHRRSYWSGNADIRDAILAIEREAAAATPSLDVPRLRRAIDIHGGAQHLRGGPLPDDPSCSDTCAESIAAEYARLDEGSATPTEGDDD
jgi:hypothetical protein